jgi:cellulose biosynthesis protein BcsQ
MDPSAVLSERFGSCGADPVACIEQLAADCDVLLIDTPVPPPQDVLCEADDVLVVARPDAASVASVAPMEALLLRTRMRSWRRPRARWLVNAFDGRRSADREALAVLRQKLGSRVLPVVVQEDRALSTAFAAGRLVHDAAAGSQAAADIEAVAREMQRPQAAAEWHASVG